MKKFLLSLLFVGPSAFVYAGGNTGGGAGCVADFMATAYELNSWLLTNGSNLNPPIDANAFHSVVDAKIIIPTIEDLRANNGSVVDARYESENDIIKVRCDRLQANTKSGLWRVVGHEFFRRMGIEGDGYELTQQIQEQAFYNAPIKPIDGFAAGHGTPIYFNSLNECEDAQTQLLKFQKTDFWQKIPFRVLSTCTNTYQASSPYRLDTIFYAERQKNFLIVWITTNSYGSADLGYWDWPTQISCQTEVNRMLQLTSAEVTFGVDEKCIPHMRDGKIWYISHLNVITNNY